MKTLLCLISLTMALKIIFYGMGQLVCYGKIMTKFLHKSFEQNKSAQKKRKHIISRTDTLPRRG